MAQANIDLIGSTRRCRYCEKTFKSEAGENNHMKRMHPPDMDSDARCWTCNMPFTKRQMLYQHFSTVQHQINCKKFHQGEMPEEKPEEKKPIGRNSGLKRKSAYRRRLMERPIRAHPYVRKQISSLRSTPAIIPLEATLPQADPRTDPKVSFLDLIELEEEINGDIKATKETCNEELQSKIEVKIQEFEEIEDNPETSQIQKHPRSRPDTAQAQAVQATETTPTNPDMNTAKENLFKMSNTETCQDPDTATEIYPEIYPEIRSTTYSPET